MEECHCEACGAELDSPWYIGDDGPLCDSCYRDYEVPEEDEE